MYSAVVGWAKIGTVKTTLFLEALQTDIDARTGVLNGSLKVYSFWYCLYTTVHYTETLSVYYLYASQQLPISIYY